MTQWFVLGNFIIEVSSLKPIASKSKGFVAPKLPSAGYWFPSYCVGVIVLPCVCQRVVTADFLVFKKNQLRREQVATSNNTIIEAKKIRGTTKVEEKNSKWVII